MRPEESLLLTAVSVLYIKLTRARANGLAEVPSALTLGTS